MKDTERHSIFWYKGKKWVKTWMHSPLTRLDPPKSTNFKLKLVLESISFSVIYNQTQILIKLYVSKIKNYILACHMLKQIFTYHNCLEEIIILYFVSCQSMSQEQT